MEYEKLTDALRLIAAELSWMVKADTKCCGITPAQIPVIDFIGQKGPVFLSDLSESIATDVSSLSRTVQTLVRLGYVARHENPEDRRKVGLILTQKGKDLNASLKTNATTFMKTLFAGLTPNKTKSVVSGIHALANLLSDGRKNVCCSFFNKSESPYKRSKNK